ncbi:oligosaccharide flippase family protein [Halovenus sp. WSH3]|uniref:Oligosaccharide flippase family protein n=1 Tax=Halovenus carboxidivorans TaxID=2692199 RepID=A0A6B0SYH9_9EURY|nr:polysaccharide biosynthesis C-terminal domain-containing protein [Halovenus carboxidivorans]MXR50425.1 oligosaccharide flippase family protein [Halovenus carboxidivorans]
MSRILEEVVGASGIKLTNRIVGFVGIIIYTRLVSSIELGQYFLFIGILGVLTTVTVSGLGSATFREISRVDDPDETFTAVLILILILLICLTLMIIPFGTVIDNFIGRDITNALILTLPLEALSIILGIVLRGEEKIIPNEIIWLFSRIMQFCFAVIAIQAGESAFTVVIVAYFIGRAVRVSISYVFIDVSLSGVPPLEEFRSLVHGWRYLSVMRWGNFGQQWVDTLLIGFFLAPASVAVYEVIWRLSSLGLFVLNISSGVLFPRLVKWIERGNSEKFNWYSRRAYLYATMPFVPLALGSVVVGESLLGLLYGSEYASGYIALVLLLFGRSFQSIDSVSNKILMATDNDRVIAIITVAVIVVNLVSNSYLIPRYGLAGAATGTGVAFLCGAVIKSWLSVKSTGVSVPLRDFAMVLISGFFMSTIVYLISLQFSEIRWLQLLVLITIGGTIFCTITAILSRAVSNDVREIFSEYAK